MVKSYRSSCILHRCIMCVAMSSPSKKFFKPEQSVVQVNSRPKKPRPELLNGPNTSTSFTNTRVVGFLNGGGAAGNEGLWAKVQSRLCEIKFRFSTHGFTKHGFQCFSIIIVRLQQMLEVPNQGLTDRQQSVPPPTKTTSNKQQGTHAAHCLLITD